jgi:hypothetical protein
MRKGLNSWEAAKDSAMERSLESSMDTPAAEMLNDTEQSGTLDFLAHQIRFEPRAQEKAILDKMDEQIDRLLAITYQDIDESVAHFYQTLSSVENDFSRLTSVELERMILQIQRIIYLATDTVSSLYNDAYWADRVQQDEYWNAYRELDGKATIGDRQSHAYGKTQDSRFYYYLRYMIWKRMSDRMSALRDLQKTLEFFRSRTIKDKPF